MAKGARKPSSKIFASSQYLVYSEFILYKGTSFYHINSSSSINLFYKLRIDFDKLNLAFDLSKNIISLTDEFIDTSNILKLFLNSLYIIENDIKDNIFVISIVKIKMLAILGYSPQIIKCNICNSKFIDSKNYVFYDYVNNSFVCMNCNIKEKKSYIKVSYNCLMAIIFIINSDVSKVFNFNTINDISLDLKYFGQAYIDCVLNSI
jgi:DNA repair protein RecO (recombination protein O)